MRKHIVHGSVFVSTIILAVISINIYKINFTDSSGSMICGAETKMCPSGVAVRRLGPNCDFSPCPASQTKTDYTPRVYQAEPTLAWPIINGISRLTKKHFGTKVSPNSSPIKPEKFNGYHTGIDFEINDQETDTQIDILAACDGPIKFKGWIKGYGGTAIQECELRTQKYTIIYGHLKLDSINHKIGKQLKMGDILGILGNAYSQETDEERKHLHFGVHRGTSLEVSGYVNEIKALKNWLDPTIYLN